MLTFGQSGAPQRNVNKHKFTEPPAEFWPEVVKAWRMALKNCITDWKLAYSHPDSDLLRGYALMDPYLIARPGSVGDLTLVAWLFIRSPWISEVATRWSARARFPSPQEWRTYTAIVGAKIGFTWRDGAASANDDKPLPPSIASLFPLPLPSASTSVDLFWRGQVVVTAADLRAGRVPITDRIRQEIIYDLYEQNFRIELLSLDRMKVFRGYMTEEAADSRDQFVISTLFPREVVVTSDMVDECLGLRHNRVRATHVNNLRRVMASWGGECSILYGDQFKISSQSAETQILTVEARIFGMYCEEFFRFFCRAPTIPHICPEACR